MEAWCEIGIDQGLQRTAVNKLARKTVSFYDLLEARRKALDKR
jgi:hypothetical protein